jgi:3-oxoadipate enol-lactonase
MQRCAFELQLPVWEEADEELLVPDVASRYIELRVPTLVGREDVSDILAIAERLGSGISGAREAKIAGAAHVPSLERPEEFDQLVLMFLGAQ